MANLADNGFTLKLFVSGESARTRRVIDSIRRVCETELSGSFSLQVIDVLHQPELAAQERIVATPTLVKVSPSPARRVVGDLSNAENVLIGLDLMLKEQRA